MHKASQSIYVYACHLTRVIDGDSVVADINLGFDIPMQKRVIRLHAFDAYEVRGKDAHYRGPAATQFVRELFQQQGPFFYLHSVYDRIAIYNRIEGSIYIPYEVPFKADGTQQHASGFIDLIESLRLNGYEKGKEPPHWGFDPTTRELAAVPAADIMEVIVRKAAAKRSGEALAQREAGA